MSSNAAQIAKDKGNASFKSGDFATAVGHYSAAIVADPRNPTYPLNRAAAYLKLGKNEDAERDCTRVIELDTKNVKAWFRRAQARMALENFDNALADLKRAGLLEPSNQDIKKEIAKTEELKKRTVIEEQEKSARRTQLSLASAPNLPPHPLRRRVPITIVEPEAGPSSKPAATPIAPSASGDLMKPVSSRPLSSESKTSKTVTPAFPPPAPQEPKPATNPGSSTNARSPPTAPLPKVSGGIFRPNGNHTIFGSQNNDRTSNASSAAKSSPTSLFTFMRIWETFKIPEQRWAFIQQIAPASLPAIFKSSLEASTLISILQTFQAVLQNSNSEGDVQTVKEYMVSLPRVPRWSTILLFLGTDERKLIHDIWERLPQDGGDTRAREAWGLGSS